MDNEKCCVIYRNKIKKRKIEDFVAQYKILKKERREFIDQNKEVYSYGEDVQDEHKSNTESIPSHSCINEDFLQFKRQGLQQFNTQNECVDSDFTIKLSELLDTLKSNDKGISDIQKWIVNTGVPHNHVDQLLKIIQEHWMPNMPKCTATLLNCHAEFNIKSMKSNTGSTGEFVYLRLKNKLEKIVKEDLHLNDVLELILFIDGLSPFKSSSASIWPILCKIYTKEDYYQPFTVAAFAGDGKPEDSTSYISDFVIEFNKFQSSGIVISNKTFKINIKFIICDTPARSFVKCVVGHVAFAGCERCNVVGKKVDKVTVFIDSNAEKKTDASFRSFHNPAHHKGVSTFTFIQPPIDMVRQFVLDPMHLLYLGVTKRILEFLLQSNSKHKVRLSAVFKKELERRTKLITKDISIEYPRKMRDTGLYSKYKAVEYKFFAQYAAPIVLKDLVSEEIYNHFMLLTTACRLMSCQAPLAYITRARSYFKKFVDQAASIYGSSFLSLNVHNLVHLCDDVETTGCNFNELSAFCFESHLGSISRALKSPTNLLAQYCNRDLEKETYGRKVSTSCKETQILMRQAGMIKKLKYKDMVLSTTHPDNTILLDDGCLAQISQLCNSDKGLIVTVNKFLRKESVFDSPCDSGLLHLWEVSHMSSSSLEVSLEKILQKFIKFQLNFSKLEENRIFVIPLLHLDPSEE